MLRIAVTGGAGSGKSLVCRCFRQLGAHVIDLDDLARQAVRPGSEVFRAIVNHFGRGVLNENGVLDRGHLRRLITGDVRKRRVLERLTHPEIRRLLEEKVAAIESAQKDAVVVVEVPLLIETGMQDRFDAVVLVEASEDLRIRRLVARDAASEEDAMALIRIQMPTEEKRSYADYIVENRGTLSETEAAVNKLFGQMRKST
jgi:dephospho-CoA kinase